MSSLVYIVTEGVHDVAFLARLLCLVHEATRMRKLEDLDDSLRQWLGTGFSWPRFTGKHHDIGRLAVQAPVIYYVANRGQFVVLRSAEGLTEVERTLLRDLESFERLSVPIALEAIGLILDSDEEPVDQRFGKLTASLRGMKLPVPAALGEVRLSTA